MGTFGLFDDQYLVVLSQHSFGGSMVNLKEHNLWRQTAMVLNHASTTYWLRNGDKEFT